MALLASMILGACGGTVSAPAPVAAPTQRTDAFLVDPMADVPFEHSVALGERVARAWRELHAGGDVQPARAEAQAVLDIDPDFAPATVLLAQLSMLDGRADDAVSALEPVASARPRYAAAQTVLAMAAESSGELVLAYEAWRRLAATPEVVGSLDRLRPRVFEILGNRFDDALGRGRLDEAELTLRRIHEWSDPERPPRDWTDHDAATAERAWRLAAAMNDDGVEREILEKLVEAEPERREAVERLAELEIANDALRRGLARLEALLERHPDDAELVRQVERAKFRWRLETFPEAVRRLASKPELSRAEVAALINWFLPEVRFAPIDRPPVATDILDHAMQKEIVRVLNASLMSIDPAVHRFSPERPAIRGDLIAALLRLPGLSDAVPSCLDGVEPLRLRATAALTCDVAVRCTLIEESGDCLPAARISGDEALELFRASFAARATMDPG